MKKNLVKPICQVLIICCYMFLQTPANADEGTTGSANTADFLGCIMLEDANLPAYVNFTDISSGEPVRWTWNFGDGGSSYQQNPTYTYYAEGCYTVTLTVEFADGEKDTIVKPDCVGINGCPPALCVDPGSLEVDASSGQLFLTVYNCGGSGDMDWHATVTQGGSWIRIVDGEEGSNSGIIKISYNSNPRFTRREGRILIVSEQAEDQHEEIIISQAGRTGGETSLSCGLSAETTVVGTTVAVSGEMRTMRGEPVYGAMVEVSIFSPEGTIDNEVELTTSDGKYDVDFIPDMAGQWSCMVAWQGDENYDGSMCVTENLMVQKAGVKLSLELASASIKIGDNQTVSGTLGSIPHNSWSKEGLSIELKITGLEGREFTQSTSTESNGKYVFKNVNGFDTAGKWTLQTSFPGNETYESGLSEEEDLYVVSSEATGYAIIVQGRIKSEEGIESHWKTVEAIYDILLERNLPTENIRVFGYSQDSEFVQAEPSREGIEEAIRKWAAEKIQTNPAPLYIIMLGHGSSEKFFLYPEMISPTDLNTWISGLEADLTIQYLEQYPLFVFIGTCNSGSFMPSVSETNRIIITSAEDRESSFRGPFESDGTRQGSYFLSEFFAAAGSGKSVNESFREAVEIIEKWSSNQAEDSTLIAEAVQHPLIDDNGDGVGSNEVSTVVGEDGSRAANSYIGTSSMKTALEITDVLQQAFLTPSDNAPSLWVEVSDSSRVDQIWLEIRPPGFSYPTVENSEQIEMGDQTRLSFDPSTFVGNRYSFNGFDKSVFSTPGLYEVFCFVAENGGGGTLPPSRMAVYRQKAGNQPPEPFSLIAPDDEVELKDSPVLFNWQPFVDPDGDSITYTLSISEEKDFSNTVLIVSGIESSSIVIDIGSQLQDGKTYYWKVEAIDYYGEITSSREVWSFYKDFSNNVLGVLKGFVFDDETSERLSWVVISSNAGQNLVFSHRGIFYIVGPAGRYQGLAVAGCYNIDVFNFKLVSGEQTTVKLAMKPKKTCQLEQAFDNCTAELVLGESSRLTLLRNFRDRFLRQYPEGGFFIESYYRHTEELTKILMANTSLRNQFIKLVTDSTSIIKRAIENANIRLTEALKQELHTFLDSLSSHSSFELKAVIKKAKLKLNSIDPI